MLRNLSSRSKRIFKNFIERGLVNLSGNKVKNSIGL